MIQTNVITPLRQRLQNCGSSLSASDFKALLDALELLEKNILDQVIASIGNLSGVLYQEIAYVEYLRAQVEDLSNVLNQVSYSVEELRLKVEDLSNVLNQVIASVGGLSFILDQVIVDVGDLRLKVEGLISKVEDLSIVKVDNAFIAQEEETYYLVLTTNGEELTRVQLPAVTRKG